MAFIRETLRLYPSAATGFPRCTHKTIAISAVKVDVIPKGMKIIPLTMVLGREKEYCGEDADHHHYRRFLNESGHLNSQAFPSFGFGYGEHAPKVYESLTAFRIDLFVEMHVRLGRRAYTGRRLAEITMVNVIRSLLADYDLSFGLRARIDNGKLCTDTHVAAPCLVDKVDDGPKEALCLQL